MRFNAGELIVTLAWETKFDAVGLEGSLVNPYMSKIFFISYKSSSLESSHNVFI